MDCGSVWNLPAGGAGAAGPVDGPGGLRVLGGFGASWGGVEGVSCALVLGDSGGSGACTPRATCSGNIEGVSEGGASSPCGCNSGAGDDVEGGCGLAVGENSTTSVTAIALLGNGTAGIRVSAIATPIIINPA